MANKKTSSNGGNKRTVERGSKQAEEIETEFFPAALIPRSGPLPVEIVQLCRELLDIGPGTAELTCSLPALLQELQQHFVLPYQGQAAYFLEERNPACLSPQATEWARRSGFIDAETLPGRQYDIAIIFGALFSRVWARMRFFSAAVQQQAANISRLFLLGSGRTLLPLEIWQMKQIIGKNQSRHPENGIDLLRLLWHRIRSESPTLVDEDAVMFCCTPEADAGTAETIRSLLSEIPIREFTGAKILAVSSQPYLRYQAQVLSNQLLAAGCRPAAIHVIGPAFEGEKLGREMFGNVLAKLLYEIRHAS
jgi:hypothetical protein